MEQHEADLIRDLIKANREDVIGRIDAQGRDISAMRATHAIDNSEMKADIRLLREEYDAVLVEMKATRKIIKLAAGIVSSLSGIATILYYLALLHII